MTDKNAKSIDSILPLAAEGSVKCPDFAKIVRLSSPDKSLFEQIAGCFSDRLEDFAKYVCRDETAGKDAFQDAMLSAMTYLQTYRGDSPIEPWLRRIVVSACSRLRRGRKNSPAVNRPIEATNSKHFADPAPDQELRLMLTERLKLVYEEIEKLDEPNRKLLKQHDLDEMSVADLAAGFNMSEDAVKSRLKRSRAQVRARLLERL